jgi:Fur family ferric uptake transcriptional regulator
MESTQDNQPRDNVKKSPPAAAVEAACARLKESGLRVTRPRRAILAALLQIGEPATIEQIHAALGPPRCDVVTTYRCLAAFAEIGLVRRSYFLDGIGRYHLALEPAAAYHVVCPESRRAATLDESASAELASALKAAEERLRALGYTAVSHRLELFGTPPA